MEQKRIRSVLRKRFFFRASVLIMAVLGCIGYAANYKANDPLWGIVFGLSGSALVWALVELFDFFVQTHHQFCLDRSNFINMLEEYFSKTKDLIRKDKANIPWAEIQIVWNELWDRVAHYPFTGSLYCICKEFDAIANYIEHIYWQFYACFGLTGNDSQEPGSPFEQKLHDKMISTDRETDATSAYFFEAANYHSIWLKIAEMEPSFDKIDLPDGLIKYGVRGDLGEQFSIPGNVHTYTTLRPRLELLERINRSHYTSSLITVTALIFSLDFFLPKLLKKFSCVKRCKQFVQKQYNKLPWKPTCQFFNKLFLLGIGLVLIIPSYQKEQYGYTACPFPNTCQAFGTFLTTVVMEHFVRWLLKKQSFQNCSDRLLSHIATAFTLFFLLIEVYKIPRLNPLHPFLFSLTLSLWLVVVDVRRKKRRKQVR